MYVLPAMCKVSIDKNSNMEISRIQVFLEYILYVTSGGVFMKIILPSLLYLLHVLVWIQATVCLIKCYAEFLWTLK